MGVTTDLSPLITTAIEQLGLKWLPCGAAVLNAVGKNLLEVDRFALCLCVASDVVPGSWPVSDYSKVQHGR